MKIAAWFFLFFGILGGGATLMGYAPGNPRWMGIVIFTLYAFAFFFFFLIAKIADLLIKIINEIKRD